MRCCLACDATNAFNTLFRAPALEAVLKYAPSLLPFVRFSYARTSRLVLANDGFEGQPGQERSRTLLSRTGVQDTAAAAFVASVMASIPLVAARLGFRGSEIADIIEVACREIYTGQGRTQVAFKAAVDEVEQRAPGTLVERLGFSVATGLFTPTTEGVDLLQKKLTKVIRKFGLAKLLSDMNEVDRAWLRSNGGPCASAWKTSIPATPHTKLPIHLWRIIVRACLRLNQPVLLATTTCPFLSLNPVTRVRDGPPCGAALHASGIHLFQCKCCKYRHHNVVRDALCVIAKAAGNPNVGKEPFGLLNDTTDSRGNVIHHRPDVVIHGFPTAGQMLMVDTSLASPVSATALNKGSASELIAAKDRESFKAKQPQNAPFPPKGLSSRLFRPFAMEHTGALGPLAHKTINELANKWSTPGNLQPPERKLLIARRTRFLTAWLSCSLQRSLAHTILACGAVADHSQSDMWHLDETCNPWADGDLVTVTEIQRRGAGARHE